MLTRCSTRTFISVLIFAVLCPAAYGNHARAQQGDIIVQGIQHEISFGQSITFYVEVQAVAGISRADLVFAEDGAPDVPVIPATCTERGDITQATATLDLTQYTLTPFAGASYTWRITDRTGRTLETQSVRLQYADTRFDWETTARDTINIHTYGQADAQAEAMLNRAVITQSDIVRQLQTPALASIDIYLYADAAALSAGLRDTSEAYADARHNVILLSIHPDPSRQLTHALTQVYVANIVDEAFVPAWLREGLALYFEAEPDAELRAAFAEHVANDTLYPLEALCPAFPSDRIGSAPAYAQSYEIVRYIESRYGPRGLHNLLAAYRRGASCRGGVIRGLGVSPEVLEHDWRLTLGLGSASPARPSVWPWVFLLLLFAVWPALFLTFAARTRTRRLNR